MKNSPRSRVESVEQFDTHEHFRQNNRRPQGGGIDVNSGVKGGNYMRNQSPQVQFQMPHMGPVVKTLLIACVVIFLLQLTTLKFFHLPLSPFLGFVPTRLLSGWVWQLFTYAFLHGDLLHILFNMLILWSIGSELEHGWGTRFFLIYFFSCSVGAAITYALFTALGVGSADPTIPVVGASGAIYGLLLAYGILFGERILHFFMIFPMKAKYFVAILGGIVLVTTVFYSDGGVAHTAHLGGMVVGLGILVSLAYWRRREREGLIREREALDRQRRVRAATHLRLVKGDDEDGDDKPPVWH